MRDGTATKIRIREEALKLFVEKGVDKATIRNIADAAQLEPGSLYVHFKSKEEIIWDLFSKGYDHYGRELMRLEALEDTFPKKIKCMVNGLCYLFYEDPDLFSFVLLTQHRGLNKTDVNLCNPFEVIRSVISDGMNRGEIPKRDVEIVSAMVIGIVLNPATSKLYGRIKSSFLGMADELSEACLRVLQN